MNTTKKQAMDKETYIYSHLKDFLVGTNGRNARLERIASWIFIEFQVNVYFCEIMGKRWSYLAGRNNIIDTGEKTPLTTNLGMIAEANDVRSDTWEALRSALVRVLQEA